MCSHVEHEKMTMFICNKDVRDMSVTSAGTVTFEEFTTALREGACFIGDEKRRLLWGYLDSEGEGEECSVYCSVLQCVAVCCNVLQCVAVLQCFAVCCGVLQCVAKQRRLWES